MIHRKSAAFEYFPLSKLQKQWRRIKNKVYDEAEDPDVLTLSDILDRGIEAKMIKRREPRAVRRQRAEDGQPQLDEFVVGGGLKRKPKEFKSEAFIESDVDDA